MKSVQGKVICEKAVYTEQFIREYQGNPLIEALPDIILSPEQFVKYTTYLPEIREEDRYLPATYRVHMLDNIKNFFKPLSYHIEVEQKISRMIRYGYINRNPNKDANKREVEGLKYGVSDTDDATVAELGIFGISGMGKTTLINKILALYPQLILHTNYKGDKTIRYQIPWLKVETPAGCGIKSLSLSILKEIDMLFGNENKYYKNGDARREYEQVPYLKDVFDIHSVGLLVIDEIQNIRGIASKESDKIMKFFVQMSNVINVPIVLIGTLKALPLFATEMKNSRRIADSPPMCKSQNDREWKAFVKSLFKLQWTQFTVEATDDLIATIYEESQGVTDIAIKLFTFAQMRAMHTGDEKITKAIIKSVASDSLIPLKPLLTALKSNKPKLLLKYEDLYDSYDFFKNFATKEKERVDLHERYLRTEEVAEIKSDEVFNHITSIVAFLVQAGCDVKRSQKIAKDVVNEYGIDIDVNILKRHAYERIISVDKQSQPNNDKNKDAEGASKKKTSPHKNSPSGMISVIEESEKSKKDGYNVLKDSNYISSESEFYDK